MKPSCLALHKRKLLVRMARTVGAMVINRIWASDDKSSKCKAKQRFQTHLGPAMYA
jgi:hypothetical protein